MEDTAVNDWDVIQARWKRAWIRQDKGERTWHNYHLDVCAYAEWCRESGEHIISLDSADEYVHHRECSSKYAGRNTARAIKAFGAYLGELYEEPNPFARLKVPKTPAPSKTPTATTSDLSALLLTCDGTWIGLRDRVIILLLAHTGMRRSEVANISPDDLVLETNRLTVPKTKTKAPRTVWLHDDVVDAILRFRRHTPNPDVMFPSATNNDAITAPGIGLMLRKRERQAGIKLGSHAWRRRFAGDWLAKGGTETGLMQAAGWTSVAMVARYSKAVAQENALSEAERLFG